MKINYQITKQNIIDNYIQVEFTYGELTYTKSYQVALWEADEITKFVEGLLPSIRMHFEKVEQRIAQAAELNVVQESPVTKEVDLPIPITATDRPAYNPDSQILVQSVDESVQGKRLQVWTVVDLTEEQKESLLSSRRVKMNVSMRQARLALMQQGKLEDVQVALDALPEPQKSVAITEWEYATTVERLSHWVIQLGSALGLDEAGLDELFKSASEL